MKLREVILSCATIFGSLSFAQDGSRLDATFIPQLRPQTSAVQSALPLPDGRVAVSELWEDPQHYFHADLACLQSSGTKDQTFISLSGVMGLFPWNDGAFFTWQNYFDMRINRHHVLNGAVDNGYHTASTGMPGLYEFSDVWDIKMDDEARAYVIGDIILTDTANGLLGHRGIIRLDQQGGLDHSFLPGQTPGLYTVLPLPDGRVVMSGGGEYNGIPVSPVFLVNEDGTLDMDSIPAFTKFCPQAFCSCRMVE